MTTRTPWRYFILQDHPTSSDRWTVAIYRPEDYPHPADLMDAPRYPDNVGYIALSENADQPNGICMHVDPSPAWVADRITDWIELRHESDARTLTPGARRALARMLRMYRREHPAQAWTETVPPYYRTP